LSPASCSNRFYGELESHERHLHTSTFVQMKSRAFATLCKGGKASENSFTAFIVSLPTDFAIPIALRAFRFSLASGVVSLAGDDSTS
jgi:hypothetical protein